MMQTAKIRARKRRRNENVIWDSRGDRILYAVAYGLMALSLLVVGYPLLYVLSASFSNGNAIQTGKVFLWPVDVTLAGYEAVFKHQLIVSGYINTILYLSLIHIFCGSWRTRRGRARGIRLRRVPPSGARGRRNPVR